jgi:glycine C-acetyltransferase
MALPERPSFGGPDRLPDPFDGLFDLPFAPAEPGALLDVPAASRWLEVVGWGMASDLYTYQQPLTGRAGPRVRSGERSYLQLSSYDYLGLVGHSAIEAAAVAAIRHAGTSTGGVRLLTGTHELHQALERDLARFLGTEAAVTFGSGYSANLGTIPALFGPRDLVIADAQIHRSISDGCRLAGVPVRRFRHNDMAALRRELEAASRPARTLIAVEGVYSMDGDLCPLDEIVALKQQAEAYLLLDEAHSLGVLGATGRGAVEAFGVQPAQVDLRTGSLAKAIPASGGFVAGARDLIAYLKHGGAPFMFSAALAPAATAAARAALLVLLREPGRLERMHRNAARLRTGLQALGFDTGTSESPLIPVVAGTEIAAWRLARELFARGIFATAVVHPAVAYGSARLRLCATAAHDDSDITEALAAFAELTPAVQG